MDTINGIVNFFSSPFFHFVLVLVRVFLVIFWISMAYWTYRDAKSRGAMAAYWSIVALIFPVFGWLIYLVVRPHERLDEKQELELEIRAKQAALARSGTVCPACMKPVESEFLLCPYCLKKLKKACPECQHALRLNWTICPYCQTSQ